MKGNRATHRVGLFQAFSVMVAWRATVAHANLSLSLSYFATIPYKVPCGRFSGLLSPYNGCSHTIFVMGCSKHEAFFGLPSVLLRAGDRVGHKRGAAIPQGGGGRVCTFCPAASNHR